MAIISFKEFTNFAITGKQYIEKDPKREKTKLGYAIKKVINSESARDVIKQYEDVRDKIVKKYSDSAEDANIDFCMTDKDGAIVYDLSAGQDGKQNRNYRFTKDNLRKRNEKIHVLKDEFQSKLNNFAKEWNEKDIEIDIFICGEVPNDVTDEEKEIFNGIVLAPPLNIVSK